MKDKPVILVVDDTPLNIELQEARLLPQGYEVVKAANAEEALDKIAEGRIDLVLLDVMMPGMNGFELCGILKRKADYLPVILVTSLSDRDARIAGIECGADDFLSKPIDATVLKYKIRNLLKTKNLYDKVEQSYREIKELDALKDSLASFIVHDLRGPLACIVGYLSLLSTAEELKEQNLIIVEKAKHSAKVMTDMIANILDIAKMKTKETRESPDISAEMSNHM